jgi:hypothetical protein
MRINGSKRIIYATLLIAIAFSFAVSNAVVIPGSGKMAYAAAKTLFKVVKPNGKYKNYTLDSLKKLPLGRITVESKVEEGPRLPDIIKNAGIKKYKSVKITGKNGSITLKKKDVTNKVILDFTNHGTVKFSSPSVPKPKWIKDITTIKVS